MNTFKQNIFKVFNSAIIFGLFLRVSGWVTNAMASKGRRERKELILVAEGTVSQGWRVLYSRGPQPPCLMTWGGADGIRTERKSTMSVMRLNHPETSTPSTPVCGKSVFQETILKRLGAMLQSSGSPEGVIPTRPCKGHLSMSADIFYCRDWGGGSYWRLIGWGEGCC